MRFSHADSLWSDFAGLVPLVMSVRGVRIGADVRALIEPFAARTRERLARSAEGEWPEIQAWRRAFSAMGLKPTQYRCAAESLLRRFRKEGALPALHPLVDLCNAASMAHGVPIAVFDVARIAGPLEVRRATGDERYEDFGGAIEQPEPGEVIFADADGWAHARRWCHRQSGRSAVQPSTCEVLIVAEAMHAGAADDLQQLASGLSAAFEAAGFNSAASKRLQRDDPVFEF